MQFAPGRSATLAQLAGDAVDTRSRSITYSYYPVRHVPWDSMVARDALSYLAFTAAYAGVTFALIAGWVSAHGCGGPVVQEHIASAWSILHSQSRAVSAVARLTT